MARLNQLLKEKDTLFLDGAMGTELQRLGYRTKLPLWTAPANEEAPQLVQKIHKDNIEAGADLITTNTFRTIRWTYSKIGIPHKAEELTKKAVSLAQDVVSRSGKEILIAGSVSTLEDCYEPDSVPEEKVLEEEHAHQVSLLKSLGVDLILSETINTIREAKAIARAAHDNTIPFISSFVTDGQGNLLSGEFLNKAIDSIEPYKASVIMLNCRPLEIINKDFEVLCRCFSGYTGLYANGCGHPHDELGWEFNEEFDPLQRYVAFARNWKNIPGFKVIGGCCGTNADYIRALGKAFTS